MSMKNAGLLILVMVMIVGVGLAKNLDTGHEPEGLDELTKQKGIFKTTLIHPDADLSRYTKLYPKKVMLVIRDPGPQNEQPSTGSILGPRSRSGVMPEWEDIVQLKQIINDAIVVELGRSGDFELVHDAGPGTLVLRAAVIDIVCDESSKNKTADGEPVTVLSQGTIVFDLIDGETGFIQMRIGERRKCRQAKGSGSSTETGGPWPNVRDWAELAAADLRQELARMYGATSEVQVDTGT